MPRKTSFATSAWTAAVNALIPLGEGDWPIA
jgi:hypothetical protein